MNKETLGIAVAGRRHRMEASLAECAQMLLTTCGSISRQFLAA